MNAGLIGDSLLVSLFGGDSTSRSICRKIVRECLLSTPRSPPQYKYKSESATFRSRNGGARSDEVLVVEALHEATLIAAFSDVLVELLDDLPHSVEVDFAVVHQTARGLVRDQHVARTICDERHRGIDVGVVRVSVARGNNVNIVAQTSRARGDFLERFRREHIDRCDVVSSTTLKNSARKRSLVAAASTNGVVSSAAVLAGSLPIRRFRRLYDM